jgi:hypothetical protein
MKILLIQPPVRDFYHTEIRVEPIGLAYLAASLGSHGYEVDFEQVYEERFERAYGFYRPYLRSVIYRYLDCGVLRNGFARVRCGECGHEYLLAFSCKRRHFCPSCHQKRVVEFGEWVCGEVLKKAPHRHFVSASPRSSGVIFFMIVHFFRNWVAVPGKA